MSGFLLDKVIVQKCDQLKPWLAQVLESFPDLADVIEIVVESKAQHEEAWAGQVSLVRHSTSVLYHFISF